ncbi:MAG: ABC transporter ATP-binding protein [Xanthomonadaceae bacterium]|nr:ABC transporter ATP-binding protein [Xanthomonadaceae bacterium]
MGFLKKLWPFIKPYRLTLFGALFLAIPLSAVTTYQAFILKQAIDEVFVGHKADRLNIIVFLIIGIFVINFFVRFCHFYFMRVVIVKTNRDLKDALYSHLMKLSVDFFSEKSSGELISRVTNDTQFIDGALYNLNTVVREPLKFIGLFSFALYLNWRLTLFVLITFPLLGWLFYFSGHHLKRYISKMAQENAKVFSSLQESFVGIRTIQTFGISNLMREKYEALTERFAKVFLKSAMVEEASHPLAEVFTAVAISAMIYYGGRQVIDNQMTVGDITSFFGAFALMIQPLRNLNEVSVKFSQATAATKRIFEIFSWQSNITELPKAKELKEFKKSLELRQVKFSYPESGSREVLRGISFNVTAGETVALVGASGAGKSSLVSLLPRLYDPSSGEILMDGTPIGQFTLSSLRSQIAVVSQDVFLFNDTIEENIRMGKPTATAEEIETAAKKAHAYDFIMRASQGFKTIIGERGLRLSGGERQRLSIARAFLRDAPLLILDEATSSLDTASERAIQDTIYELMVGKTTIMIAHRLSTVQKADQIYVLKEGQIIEQGRHEELVARRGEYYRLNQQQHPV